MMTRSFRGSVSLLLLSILFALPAHAQSLCIPSAATPASTAQTTQTTQAEQTEQGRDCFAFSEWAGPPIPVWLYVPSGIDQATAPIAIIMHGARRDADRYRDEWQAEAKEHGFIVVAPGFSRADFPKAAGYNLGAMRDADTREWRDPDLWSFTAIEPVFDAVLARLKSSQSQYTLYGHSAGSQFVHRSLFFKPGPRVKRYLAANAGWYTFPDFDTAFPFGLGDTMLDKGDVQKALAKDVIILLGDEDIDPQGRSLNRSDGAMQQGPHRFARGKAFFAAAQEMAERNGWKFGWSIQVVEGVAHSNSGMAKQAAVLIE